MKLADVHINGIGTVIPERVDTDYAVAQGWYNAAARRKDMLVSIAVAGTTPAPELAITAARAALKQSEAADTVGLLLHSYNHPQGPDGWSVQHYINLHTVDRPITAAVVNNGCLGVLSAMTLAATWLRSRPSAESVLLTSADNVGTPAVDRWRTSDLYVLADAGGSLVLSRRPGIATVLSIASVSDPSLELIHRGGEPLFPPSITVGGTLNFEERLEYLREKWRTGEMTPIGDFGAVVEGACRAALADAGITMDEVTRVAHVGFSYQPLHDVYLDPLGIDDDRAIWEFTRNVGHAGPVDPILGLDYLIGSGAVHNGDIVAIVSGAPGMEAACAIVRITDA
ncbi:3-oxoacyl-ACP synthase [Nocardia terpenica]|uniref:ketoacyl-ACP synthase III family protein n=1 Tax=Nocardia terpenica TaxID=455432 RepID=UPI002FE16C19